MSEPKQVLVVRTDLNMRKGKMAAQAAHASMKVFLDQSQELLGKDFPDIGATGDDWLAFPLTPITRDWLLGGVFKKIVVGVDSEAGLLEIHEKAKTAGLLTALVQDHGLTEFGGVKTYTAVAVGPDDPEKIDAITKHLKLL